MAIDGTWNIEMETPLGTRRAKLDLKSAGATLTGKMSGQDGSTDIADGKVNGDQVSWKTDITQPMSMTLEFSATVSGDSMSGKVKLGMFGDAPLKGSRG